MRPKLDYISLSWVDEQGKYRNQTYIHNGIPSIEDFFNDLIALGLYDEIIVNHKYSIGKVVMDRIKGQ